MKREREEQNVAVRWISRYAYSVVADDMTAEDKAATFRLIPELGHPPCIESITEGLGMSSHAAGASFMAVGVTVPEVALAGVEVAVLHADNPGINVIEAVRPTHSSFLLTCFYEHLP